MSTLFWKPFDARFADLIDRMQAHQELFDREMHLADQQVLAFHFEEFEKYRRQQAIKGASEERELLRKPSRDT
jgi:hypothetical protein